jgi:hypothetical protein
MGHTILIPIRPRPVVSYSGVSVSAASALLRQLQASFHVHLGEVQYFDYEAGARLWLLSAADNSGVRWVAKHEDYYKAACMLAELMGFELEDG